MKEEEKQALEILKGLEFEEYDWYVRTDKIEGHSNDVVEKVEKALQTILNLVEKQQKEIEELKGKNKGLFEEYNKRVSTIMVYEQGLKEIIDEEDDPHTWAYHAVKKLLEEVGGIEYE